MAESLRGQCAETGRGEDSLGRTQSQDMGPDSPFGRQGEEAAEISRGSLGISCRVVAVCSYVSSWKGEGMQMGRNLT